MSTNPTINPRTEAAPGAPGTQTQKSAQRFWQRYFKFYDTLNAYIPYRKMLERHAELLEPLNGALTLDAGTGTGNVAELLVARGATVTGIDFCEPALEKCRWKVRQAEFHFGDLTQPLAFTPASFDRVACCLVLHLLRPQRSSWPSMSSSAC